MYDPHEVLAAIDAHRWSILALCGLAMVCNYTWFIAAVRQGLRDQVYPIPVFCTLFWLAGDGSMVLRYDLWFNVYNHWYMKLFWSALVLTVACELVFLYMTLRFGRKELAPSLSEGAFRLLVTAGVVVAMIIWDFVKTLIGDDLYITYFHLANMAGPVFAAPLLFRRGSRAGTTPLIWAAYTLMVVCWFTACALWFDGPFASPKFLLFYAVCTVSSAAMTVAVLRTPKYAQAADGLALNSVGVAERAVL